MGAGYGGGTGISLTYQESATFTQNGGAFVLDLLSNDTLGIGFDSALFTISLNNIVFDSQSFTDLAMILRWRTHLLSRACTNSGYERRNRAR
jgi:hypothetical protein